MSWVDDALADFGRGLGLEPLTFNDRGVMNLDFEVTGSLYMERLEGGLLIYLCREVDRQSKQAYAAALDLCHWRNNHPTPVNAALYRENVLVFSIRLNESDVNVPALEQSIQLLNQLHNRIHEEVPA